MTIPAFSTYPQRSAPSTFSADMDTFMSEMAAFIAAANSLASACNGNETQTSADVVTCAAHVASCAASVVTSAASAVVAQSGSNYKGPWTSCTGAATMPYCVSHLGRFWYLSSNLADVTAKTPGTDSEWVLYSVVSINAKTADATLSAPEMAGNTVITNTGATGAVNLTLLAGAVGLSFEFEVTTAQYLRFTAAGSDKFRCGTEEGAGGGYIRSNTIGSRGKCTWSGGNWTLHDLTGYWLYDK